MPQLYYRLVNREAIQCGLEVWAACLEEDRSIARHKFDGIVISTVFLGLDHSFGNGPPLIFETMVFGGIHDGECTRYSTWDQAVAGHRIMVKKIKGVLNKKSAKPVEPPKLLNRFQILKLPG
jgi:hypothetical protein